MKEIIEHLRKLSDGSIIPEDPTLGLCEELDILGFDRRHRRELFEQWPERSGTKYLPVPHEFMDGGSAFAAFFGNLNMWDPDVHKDNETRAEYCRARRRLCAWLADYLEERL